MEKENTWMGSRTERKNDKNHNREMKEKILMGNGTVE